MTVKKPAPAAKAAAPKPADTPAVPPVQPEGQRQPDEKPPEGEDGAPGAEGGDSLPGGEGADTTGVIPAGTDPTLATPNPFDASQDPPPNPDNGPGDDTGDGSDLDINPGQPSTSPNADVIVTVVVPKTALADLFADEPKRITHRFNLYRGGDAYDPEGWDWRWRMIARNGHIVGNGGQGYTRLIDMVSTLRGIFDGTRHEDEVERAVLIAKSLPDGESGDLLNP